MARAIGKFVTLLLLTVGVISPVSAGPPHRHGHSHRHYGGHPYVYVQHESLWNSPRGVRNPWFGRRGLNGFSAFGFYPYGYGYGFGGGLGFSSGLWINTYPAWGGTSGYYGYTGNAPLDIGSINGTLETPFLSDLPNQTLPDQLNGSESVVVPRQTTRKNNSREQVISRPEVREWLPQAKTVKREGPPVDPADMVRSLRYQTEGDRLFRNEDYMNAYLMYSRAAVTVESRAEPRMRMGYALAAAGQWSRSLKEVRHALDLDPELPKTGGSLTGLFGSENDVARNRLIAATRQWADEDLRDNDRLFLMGVLLHFNDQSQYAATLFAQVAQTEPDDPYAPLFLDRRENTEGLTILKSKKEDSQASQDENDNGQIPPPPEPGVDLTDLDDEVAEAKKPQTDRRATQQPERSFGPLFPTTDGQ